jgi:hypothetical protein
MSKTKRRIRALRVRPARLCGRRTVLVAVTVVLAVGILAAFALLHGGAPGGAGSPAGSQAASTAPAAGSGFGTLNGRWLRPDGGYVLEIRNVAASGKVDAGYFNPQPINVARAEATRDGSTLKVFVELRAPGYPGSTYALTYDPRRDELVGVYFQAALRQSFKVVFGRVR